jgi:DNA-binding CsgD family transcriptional regulator
MDYNGSKYFEMTRYSEVFAAWKEQEFIPDLDKKEILENIKNISQKIGMKEGLILACFDYRDLSLPFFTDNLEDIIGYPLDFFRKNGIEAVLTIIHEADRAEVYRFQNIVLNIFKSLQPEEKETFEWSYTVRWKHHSTNQVKWFYTRAKPFYMDSKGNLVFDLHLIVHLVNPPVNKEFDWSYSYTKLNGEKVVVSKNEPAKKNGVLTKKEKEIANLLLDGLNSQEIAEKLFISKYTVLTHRKKLLKKLNAKNTAEMMKILISTKFD